MTLPPPPDAAITTYMAATLKLKHLREQKVLYQYQQALIDGQIDALHIARDKLDVEINQIEVDILVVEGEVRHALKKLSNAAAKAALE